MDPEKVERIAKLRRRARQLRNNPTPSETAFWNMVRRRRFRGHRFRRQVVADPYIVDFYCRDLKLVVEIDGPAHARVQTRDRIREKNLTRAGFQIFRFFPREVLERPDKVWSILAAWHDRDQD